MTKVWRCGLMTLKGYWVSFDHRGKRVMENLIS